MKCENRNCTVVNWGRTPPGTVPCLFVQASTHSAKATRSRLTLGDRVRPGVTAVSLGTSHERTRTRSTMMVLDTTRAGPHPRSMLQGLHSEHKCSAAQSSARFTSSGRSSLPSGEANSEPQRPCAWEVSTANKSHESRLSTALLPRACFPTAAPPLCTGCVPPCGALLTLSVRASPPPSSRCSTTDMAPHAVG